MKNLLKKTIIAAAVLSLTLVMFGCAQKGMPLEISQTATASAQGIINGIANMDDYSAEQMLDLETDEIEEFFEQYGYSLDGEAYSAETPTAVNAGEYTVYFKAAEADEPQSITITVAKADAVFTPPVAAVSGNEGE